MIYDSWLYSTYVLYQWQGWVTGGALVAIITVYERLVVKRQVGLQISAAVFLVAGFMGASFEVWRDIHHKLLTVTDRLKHSHANITEVLIKRDPTSVSETGRILFQVTKTVHHPIIHFIFSAPIKNAYMMGSMLQFSANMVAPNVFRVEFEFPELIQNKYYEVSFNSDTAVEVLAIFPEFSDPLSRD